MSLTMSLHGRGRAGTVARTATVLARFGATASAMARRLHRYDAIASEFGVRPTWPTTACVLARNPGNVDLKPERGVEFEAGFETALFDDRFGLELTFFDKKG